MNSEFEAVLDECLAQMRKGATVQHCLERYPEHRDALAPLLTVAVELRQSPPPTPLAARRTADRQRVLAHMETVSTREATQSARRQQGLAGWLRAHLLIPGNRPAWTAVGAILIAVLLLTSGVTVRASVPSLPGDRLYPIKLTAQQAQLVLTFDAERRQALQEKLDLQRLQEVRQVLSTERRTDVEFQGLLQEQTDSLWQVGGLSVIVTPDTRISGVPGTGALVLVKGYLPGDGSIVAERLVIRDGAARALPESSVTPDDDAPPKPTVTPTRPAPPDEPAEPAESSGSGDESSPSDDGEQDGAPADQEAGGEDSSEHQDPTPAATEDHEDDQDDHQDGTPSPEPDDDSDEEHDEDEATPTPEQSDDGGDSGDEEHCTPTPTPSED